MALSYVDLYCKERNINNARLVTATELDENSISKLKALAQRIKPGTLELETQIDPNVDGGFVLYIDTYRLDASVRMQLNKIKQDLINENSKVS